MKPYYSESGIEIYLGDCREILPQLPKCDLILTDPPYGVGKADWDGYANFRSLIGWLGAALPNALCDNGLAIIFTSTRFLYDVITAMDVPYRWQFIWACSNNMIPGDLGFAKYTSALMFTERSSIHADAQDLRDYPAGTNELQTNGHPTPKPLPLIKYLTQKFSSDTDAICDPFCGSGTTLVAAKHLGRQAIGIEIEEKYCEIAALRLQQSVFEFPREDEKQGTSIQSSLLETMGGTEPASGS